MAVVADNPKLKGKLKGPMAVGSWPDSNSTYQAMDLAGNVMEWVDEKVDPTKASLQTIGKLVTPPAAADELWVQLRGGSYFNELLKNASFEFIRAPARFSSPDVGFRCVVDATVKPK
jgi:formylglycine-generating enzyme required for sulfatase activity